jgi:hypothetical protein
MRNTIVSLLSVLFLTIGGFSAQAYTVKTKVGPDPKTGQLTEAVILTCSNEESLCTKTCGDAKSCYKTQEICYNCLGTSNPLMRTLFTELNQYYKNSGKLVAEENLPNVFKANHIFIAARSIFNFYTNVQSEDVAKKFSALCPRGSMNPIVVLETNGAKEVTAIKYVVCDPMIKASGDMYILEYSPSVQSDEDQSAPLELKLSPSLKLK